MSSSPFWSASSASGFSSLLHQRADRERNRLELELARLDLREVEDVVEDREQRLGRRLAPSSRQSRCSAVSSVSSASSVMPMMPFIGVRISWLMLARNSLLARLASIALSRAAIRSVLAARSSAVRASTVCSSSFLVLQQPARRAAWISPSISLKPSISSPISSLPGGFDPHVVSMVAGDAARHLGEPQQRRRDDPLQTDSTARGQGRPRRQSATTRIAGTAQHAHQLCADPTRRTSPPAPRRQRRSAS